MDQPALMVGRGRKNLRSSRLKYKVPKKKEIQPRRIDPLPFLAGAFFVALPFIVSFSGFDKFRTPKDIFATLSIILLASILLGLRRFVRTPERNFWNLTLAVGLVYLGLNTLLLRSASGPRSFFQILYFVALLLIVKEIASERFQKQLWLAVGLAFSLSALFAVLQSFGLFSILERDTGEELAGRLTPAGFIGDVNSGGFLFALICLISLYGIAAERKTSVRVISALIFCANLTGLAFTRTLTALVAVSICLIIWLIFHHWWVFRYERSLGRELVLIWVLLAGGIVAGSIVAARAGVLDRLQVVYTQMKQGDWMVATAGRQPVYLITWEMIKERPLTGHGLQSFGEDFYTYRADNPYGQSLRMIDQPGAFRQVHNEYLQVWEELGLVGLTAFLLLFGLPLVQALRRVFLSGGDPRTAYWIFVLALGLIFILISCLSFFPLHLSVTAAYAILLLGCLRAFEDPPWTELRGEPVVWKKLGPALGAMTLAAIFLAYHPLEKWYANRQVGIASFLIEQAHLSEQDLRRRRIFADEAMARLGRAEEAAPDFYEIYNLQGSAAMLLGQTKKAQQSYRKASRHLPSPEVYTNLAAAHLAAREYSEARPLLESALRYNPGYLPAQRALEYLENNQN